MSGAGALYSAEMTLFVHSLVFIVMLFLARSQRKSENERRARLELTGTQWLGSPTTLAFAALSMLSMVLIEMRAQTSSGIDAIELQLKSGTRVRLAHVETFDPLNPILTIAGYKSPSLFFDKRNI